jgi:hypothetical protein
MERVRKVVGPVSGGLLAVTGGHWINREMESKLDTYPFVASGLSQAGLPESTPLCWYKKINIDKSNTVAYATVYLKSSGVPVRITAKKSLPPLDPLSTPSSSYDDLYAEGSGVAFYWENPWEIKQAIKRGFHQLSAGIRDIKNEYIGEHLPGTSDDWTLTSLIIGSDRVIMGSKSYHPDFASQSLPEEPSSGRRRAIIVLGSLVTTATLMGVRRAWINHKIRPGFAFAKTFVTSHPTVRSFYKSENIEVVSRVGEFARDKIHAELTIRATDGIESTVKIEAAKRGSDWVLSHALMVPTGCDQKPIDLLTRIG